MKKIEVELRLKGSYGKENKGRGVNNEDRGEDGLPIHQRINPDSYSRRRWSETCNPCLE